MSLLILLPLHTASRSVSVYLTTKNEMKQHVCFLIVSSCIAAPSVVCSVNPNDSPIEKKTCFSYNLCASALHYIFPVIQTLMLSSQAELSSGLAALTVGCDSGNLGSLSRVQLLLLDRLEPENLPSPFGMEEERDWDLREQYDPELDGKALHERGVNRCIGRNMKKKTLSSQHRHLMFISQLT